LLRRNVLRAAGMPRRAGPAAARRRAVGTPLGKAPGISQRRRVRQKGFTMNRKQWLLAFALVDLMAINAFAVHHYGLLGFFQAVVSSLASVAVLVDLTIAISLIAVWMWSDAKRRGISPLPYVVTSALLGSVGPLAYLLRTSGGEAPAALPAAHLAADRAR
jgi:hypothetical protein